MSGLHQIHPSSYYINPCFSAFGVLIYVLIHQLVYNSLLGSRPKSRHATKSHGSHQNHSTGSKTQRAHYFHDGQQSSTIWPKPCAQCAESMIKTTIRQTNLEGKTQWAHYFHDGRQKYNRETIQYMYIICIYIYTCLHWTYISI